MTTNILLTRDVCRDIVKSGLEEHRYSEQNMDILTNTPISTGHLIGRIASYVTDGNADFIDDGIDNDRVQYIVNAGNDSFHVFCPLTSDTIPLFTRVMFQRNASNGHWEIFATECY